ncbi:MAG TPA: zf-HC2 domain-containing protein [Candidatus Eremiobacteraceae bacterium]|nr:zf-HC2 domain-containing protein [Candidatus Eremiobacteraceae bacterium]
MECYSEQACALFVDGELAADEAQRMREHMATCRACRHLLDALRAENRVLSESLSELSEEAASPVAFSRLRLSGVWRDLAVMAVLLALGSIFSGWFDQIGIPGALEWVNPFSGSGLTNLVFNVSDYFARGGTAMLNEYAEVVGGFVFLLLLGGSALVLGRRWRLPRAGFGVLMVLLTLSLSSFALDRRHGEFVTVPVSETVDDTLMAAGNTVRIEGVINGDLLAFARTVEIRGTVKGDLVSFAKRIVVSGTVEGRIFDFSQSLDLNGQLGHSIYGFAQVLRVNDRAHVGEGILAAAGDVSLEGEVKRSVDILTSGNADVSGSIGRDLTMNGVSLTLSNTARVGGNLSARVHQLKEVHIADGATIAGKRDIQVQVRKSRYARPRFYFHQAVWFAAAMVVGWLGLLLFPGFFRATTQAVGSGWLSLGLGVGVLAGVPVALVVVALTLVGIPISLMVFAVYLVAIYLAKVWVGAFLGRILLKPSGATKGDWLLGLLVGLLILTIVGFIPYLGGLVRLGVVCLGLGAFAGQLYRASRPAITV